jgi:hypothetical protein
MSEVPNDSVLELKPGLMEQIEEWDIKRDEASVINEVADLPADASMIICNSIEMFYEIAKLI